MAILDPRRILFFEASEENISDELIERTIKHIDSINQIQHSDFEKRIQRSLVLLELSKEYPQAIQNQIVDEINTFLQAIQDDQEDYGNTDLTSLSL
ncbi:MAG: hypothetical protein P1U32_06340 [Legionellaceae bacterium]|nr:hypothetical protein [Legionellaceae bacterium]